MAKWLLNLFGTLLFMAALAAAATPAPAQDIPDIQQNETCQHKVGSGHWYLCGRVPADGHITYENTGIHKVTVFTTGPDGLVCEPEVLDTTGLEECGALQVHEGLPVHGTSQTDVDAGQLVYIARADVQWTTRTLAIQFTAVPPNDDLGHANPLSEARMFVELNVTTEDLGIRAFLDGEPWNTVQIIGPDHQRIFQVAGVGSLGEVGLTELSFATHELAQEDLSLEDLLALFPAGDYEFRGRTVEGDRLLGTATLTHDLPDPPQILTPEEGVLVDPDDAVISWDPVTEPAGIEIAGYRVIVERGDRGRSLSLELPPETTSVLVPPDFLEPHTDYLFQVFATEVGGNQTITEAVFDTAEGGLGGEPELCGDETSKCVFLSSTNQNGNLGGLNGADGICQNLADAEGSLAAPGTYKAWLSTAAASAVARLTHATVPYKLVDGTTIASNWDDLTDRALAAPINVTEGGSSQSGLRPVWTATNEDGTFVGPDCTAWTSTSGSGVIGATIAQPGPALGAAATWTHATALRDPCSAQLPLYCFQQ